MSSSSSDMPLLSKRFAEAAVSHSSQSSFYPATVSAGLKSSSMALPKDKHGSASYEFSDRKRVVRTTAYSCMENEPGAEGSLTSSGSILKYGAVRSAAADWSRYPLGTKFKIKGLPHTYVVEDYGSSLVGTNTLDIYHPNLSLMKQWGTREVEITVIQWGSWERSVNLLKGRTRYPHCNRMYTASIRHLPTHRSASR